MRPKLEVISRSDIESIQNSSFDLLQSHGVRVLEPVAVDIFEKHGASVDRKRQVVRIPEGLLRETVKKAPREFVIHGRGKGQVVRIEKGNTVMSSVGTGVQVLDLDGRFRSATVEDVRNSFKLLDALPNIKYASWTVWPTEVPQGLGHAYEVISGFRNTTKPFDGYTWGARHALDTIELAAIVAGGVEELKRRPMLLGFANPVSPLTLSKEPTEGIMVYAEYGQPLVFPPECQAGGTAPATIAGLLVQQNAEVLASVVLSQLVNPGTPVLYGTVSTVMDMRSGNIALGAPEAGMIGAATVQLAHSCGLPCRATGGNTESFAVDYQAGVEGMTTLLMPALAGAEFIYDAAGSLESSLTVSFEKLVLDDEVCGAVDRILRGFTVDSSAMAMETIKAVGYSGPYLSQPHTLMHFKTEHFVPRLFNRRPRKGRMDKFSPDTLRRANERASELLKSHVVPPLEEDVDKELNRMFERIARREIGKGS